MSESHEGHTHAVRAECSYCRWHTAVAVHLTRCCRRVIAFTLQPLYTAGPTAQQAGWTPQPLLRVWRGQEKILAPVKLHPGPCPSHYTDSLSPQIYGLLGYYVALSGNSLPTFRDKVSAPSARVKMGSVSQWRTEGGVWGVQTPPPRNSEDTGGDLHRTTKKNRRLDFLL